MYIAFPIKKSLNKAMGELVHNEYGQYDWLRERMPRCSDGRILLNHPLRKSGSEYVIRNRMELFRNAYGGEKSDEHDVHSLFTGNLKRLAQAYGFEDGTQLMSYSSSLDCGELTLMQFRHRVRYVLMSRISKEWQAAGLDLKLGSSELDALNLSMTIYAAMSQVMQFIYAATRQYVQYPLEYIPLLEHPSATLMAQAYGYTEYEYIQHTAGSDTATLFRHLEIEEGMDAEAGTLNLKFKI